MRSKQQYEQAIVESARAIALDPNNALRYAQRAEVLNWMGKPEEALQAVEQAMRLNPRATKRTVNQFRARVFQVGAIHGGDLYLQAASSRAIPLGCQRTPCCLSATCGSGTPN